MKSYFVRIATKSIKRNKNAGDTITYVLQGKTIKFKTEILPDNFKDGENIIITNYGIDEYCSRYFEGLIIDKGFFEELIKNIPVGLYLNINADWKEVTHLPISKYSFEYENTEVLCEYCKKRIMTKNMGVSELFDNDDNIVSDSICPECGTIDCVDLSYEKIENALKRKKK